MRLFVNPAPNVTPAPTKPRRRFVWRAGKTKDSDAFEVFVDGLHPFLCIAANVSEGWADCFAVDEDGRIDRDRDGVGEKPKVTRVEGRVEIRPVRDAAWAGRFL